LVVTLGNPSPTSRSVELKLWVDWEPYGEDQFSLVPSNLVLSIPPMSPTEVIDAPLPVTFPGVLVVGQLVEPLTGFVLADSRCAESPCE
jgi:hypothetical protein